MKIKNYDIIKIGLMFHVLIAILCVFGFGIDVETMSMIATGNYLKDSFINLIVTSPIYLIMLIIPKIRRNYCLFITGLNVILIAVLLISIAFNKGIAGPLIVGGWHDIRTGVGAGFIGLCCVLIYAIKHKTEKGHLIVWSGFGLSGLMYMVVAKGMIVYNISPMHFYD